MKFGVILADPAWNFAVWSDKGKDRSPDYKVMTLDDIKSLPVASIADDNCILFLWVTFPLLKEGIETGEAWGFTYKTCGYVWAKQTSTGNHWHMGLGYYTRANAEICLIFTKGKPKRIDKSIRQLVIAPVGKHSAKPIEVHERIEKLMGDVSYCELFARQTRDGWICLGNEIDGLDLSVSIPKIAGA